MLFVATVVLEDLQAEYEDLDALLARLPDPAWDRPSAAEGWAVRDQVSHLAFSEELATLAATDADAFQRRLADLLADVDAAERLPREHGRGMAPGELLEWWRQARADTLAALRARAPDDRVPWVVGDMKVPSFATARLMETWAHGRDVADAVGEWRLPTPRLRHIAELGVRTRRFSYVVRGLAMPEGSVRVELAAPGGGTWTWGDAQARDRVEGSAEDFCLVVTQRRHWSNTSLVVTGAFAEEWMEIAQAFAGPPTSAAARRRAHDVRGGR